MTSARGGRLRRLAAPLGLAMLVLASAPATAAAAAASATTSRHAANTTTTICVGVIVDYEGLSTAEPNPNSFCARVPSGSTGTDVLDARAKALHLPAPTFTANGLLCQIDGVPAASVCNTENASGGFNYWSYWERPPGAATWTYAREGPSSTEPANGAQEGWTWVAGQSEAGAPRPPLLSEAVVCPATSTTSTPTPSATAPATRTPAPASSAPPPPTSGATTSNAATTRTPGNARSTAVSAGAGHLSPSANPSRTSTGTTISSSSAGGAPPSSAPGGGVTHLEATASTGGVRPAAATAWIAGLALIAVIGVAAWWRSRSP